MARIEANMFVFPHGGNHVMDVPFFTSILSNSDEYMELRERPVPDKADNLDVAGPGALSIQR